MKVGRQCPRVAELGSLFPSSRLKANYESILDSIWISRTRHLSEQGVNKWTKKRRIMNASPLGSLYNQGIIGHTNLTRAGPPWPWTLQLGPLSFCSCFFIGPWILKNPQYQRVGILHRRAGRIRVAKAGMETFSS